MNNSIVQAVEIKNRIRKVQQLEQAPLIDSYNELNEAQAHPFGFQSNKNKSRGE